MSYTVNSSKPYTFRRKFQRSGKSYDLDLDRDLDDPDDEDDDDELRLLRDFVCLGDRLRERLRDALGERERRAVGDLPRDLL